MHKILIDGNTRNAAPNSFWRGFGFISANNSSRLLLDYRDEHPEVYQRILQMLFDPKGAIRMNHIKIELGADINSSSGTEPSPKRSADEPADVTRGAGFRLAADALAVNPNLTLELLSWGVPGYICHAPAEEQFQLRYNWFREVLEAAYKTYGLRFSYIDPNINERAVEKEWLKYFSARLKAEQDEIFSGIQIVAADEEVHFHVAGDMLRDSELMQAVDVIGIHYTSSADENTLRCKREFGKELWYSEGLAPANIPALTVRVDGSGLCGVNGFLDVAGRIVNMYPNGGYTMYEFQPAVAAYYSGVCYYPKQLILANEPWSGHIEIGAGMYMAAHFGAFSQKGWQFIDSACFGDGIEQNHVLYDTKNNYLTLSNPETDDYSIIFVNHSDTARDYQLTVKHLKTAKAPVFIWETRSPEPGQQWDANYFRQIGSLTPDDACSYTLTVQPNSMVTVSTLQVQPVDFSGGLPAAPMQLPYADDFSGANLLTAPAARGFAPRYTTDLGGAFELRADAARGMVLRQCITAFSKGSEWGYTPEPVTSFGDDTWANYTVSADVRLERGAPAENYAGIGVRYINGAAEDSKSGYRLQITGQGKWQLFWCCSCLAEGMLPGIQPGGWHRLSLTADGDLLRCAIDGSCVAEHHLQGTVTFSGRAALYSGYFGNDFSALQIEPAGANWRACRVDDLDSSVTYSGSWKHCTMDSFTRHNRTSSENDGSAQFSVDYTGSGLALIGTAEHAELSVNQDGKCIAEHIFINSNTAKGALWHTYGIPAGAHRVEVTVHAGRLQLDAVEYLLRG